MGVFVQSLKLNNFRSYASLRITLDTRVEPIILTGPNGAGKTNILEALSFLAPGRGLRRAALSEVGRIGAPSQWAVAATINNGNGTGSMDVGTGLAPMSADQQGNNKRLVRVDGNYVAGPAAFADIWSVSWLTPQMDRLFLEGPSSRRRFLDRLMLGLYPDHARQVSAYERAMRERNRLLSMTDRPTDPAWLSALEGRMAAHGIAVAASRIEFAELLLGQIEKAPEGPFPKASLTLDGSVEQALLTSPATQVEEMMKEQLKHNRKRDAQNGRTNEGPHKCDLKITHKAKNMPAEQCSTGEQKALMIGLILANAHLTKLTTGAAPLMLLDEVVAHLDNERRLGLFDALLNLESQCWLTGTDRALFEGLTGRAKFFEVADSKVYTA